MNRPRLQLLLLFLLFLLSPLSTALRFADIIGVNDATTDPLLQPMAVTMVRNGVNPDFDWNLLQPARGAPFNFTATDRMVEAVLAQGRQVLPILGYSASWAVKDGDGNKPADNVTEWELYVDAVVSHYLPKYNISYYQIWNEPTTQAGFWHGANNSAFVPQVYLPAAKIVRARGGRVVFGGWPASNSIDEFNQILNTSQAYALTDVIDVHYRDLPGMVSLAETWMATGKIKGGLWQSELGWNTFEGLLPSVYTRFFHWAITRGAALAPAAGGDAYRLLWYAWWQPGDNRTLVNNAPAGAAGTVPTFHGRQLMHLAALFGDNGTCAVTALDGAFATRPPLPSTALGDSDPAAVGFRVHGRAASGSDRAVVALFLAPNATATVAVQSPTLTTAAQRAATATDAAGQRLTLSIGASNEVLLSSAAAPALSLMGGGAIRVAYVSWPL